MTKNRDRVPTGEEFDKVAREPGGNGILRFFKMVRRFKVSEGIAEGKRIAQVSRSEPSGREAPIGGSRLVVKRGDAPAATQAAGTVVSNADPPPVPPETRGGDSTPSQRTSTTGALRNSEPATPARIAAKPQRKITVSPKVTDRRAAARAQEPIAAPLSSRSWEKDLTMEEMHRRIGPPQQYGDDL